jgi:hypothetical protein
MALWNSAERDVGARYDGSFHEQAAYLLKEASRSRAVSPRAYQLLWFVYKTTRPELVIPDTGVSP